MLFCVFYWATREVRVKCRYNAGRNDWNNKNACKWLKYKRCFILENKEQWLYFFVLFLRIKNYYLQQLFVKKNYICLIVFSNSLNQV